MGVHCSRPHDGSDPGGVGCLRLSGLQSTCEVQVWAQAPGWIVRKGGGEEQDISNDERRRGLSPCPRRVQLPALDVTMAPKEPQPRVEGVSLSGAMARQGGSLHHGQSTGVASTLQRKSHQKGTRLAIAEADGWPRLARPNQPKKEMCNHENRH